MAAGHTRKNTRPFEAFNKPSRNFLKIMRDHSDSHSKIVRHPANAGLMHFETMRIGDGLTDFSCQRNWPVVALLKRSFEANGGIQDFEAGKNRALTD